MEPGQQGIGRGERRGHKGSGPWQGWATRSTGDSGAHEGILLGRRRGRWAGAGLCCRNRDRVPRSSSTVCPWQPASFQSGLRVLLAPPNKTLRPVS